MDPEKKPDEDRAEPVVIGRFRCAIPSGCIDADRTDLDVVVTGVAHDLCRRIKSRRLRIEERSAEHFGMPALDP